MASKEAALPGAVHAWPLISLKLCFLCVLAKGKADLTFGDHVWLDLAECHWYKLSASLCAALWWQRYEKWPLAMQLVVLFVLGFCIFIKS